MSLYFFLSLPSLSLLHMHAALGGSLGLASTTSSVRLLSVVAPLLALCSCECGLFYCRVRVRVTC